MFTLTAPAAHANSVGEVDGARSKERSGSYLTRQEREQTRRYGGNDDFSRPGYDRYYGGFDDGSYDDDGPGVSLDIGPRDRFGYGYGYGYLVMDTRSPVDIDR